MERLTERLENNERIVRCNGTYGEAMRKLADYEDAEEQGRLIELPFSYGDTIFEIYESERKVIEWTVTGFSISPNGTYVNIGKFGIALNTAKLGDTLFRTWEEAEAKLKEMGDEDG